MSDGRLHMKGHSDAQSLYQRLLDQIGEAVINKDRSSYIRFFSVPHRLETFDKAILIPDEEELGRYFSKLIEHLESLEVRELSRHCTVAEFTDQNTIQGCHHTRLVNRSNMIVEDYSAFSILKKEDGVWKVVSSQYAEEDPSLPTRICDQTLAGVP